MRTKVHSDCLGAIAWQGYYSVGNDHLDQQHRQIIAMVNWLFEATMLQQDQQAVPSLIRELIAYTSAHFADEEQMMRQSNYPGYEEHKRAHRQLTERTYDLHFRTMQANPPRAQDVLKFLKDWWVNHITGDDKAYAPYLQ